MKKLLLVLCCFGLLLPPSAGRAQDPGAQQDAEAAREKLLKAADQIDLMESNSEANKTEMDNLEADLKKVQDANAALTQQVAALQDQVQKADADRVTERQVLLDEVAKMVASSKTARPAHHHEDAVASTEPPGPANESAAVGANDPPAATPRPSTSPVGTPDAPTADSAPTDAAPPSSADNSTPAPAPQVEKGYYHIVARHETLSMIAAAYRAQGVKVTTSQIRKANGLTEKSVLKVGEKLFIPKPGTAT